MVLFFSLCRPSLFKQGIIIILSLYVSLLPAQHSTAHPSTAHPSTAQTGKHSTAQKDKHSTAQHSSRHRRHTYLKGLNEDGLCQPGRAVVGPSVVIGLQRLHNATCPVSTRKMTGTQKSCCIAASASTSFPARQYFARVQSRRLVIQVDCRSQLGETCL